MKRKSYKEILKIYSQKAQETKFSIAEIFCSIQGEGLFCGIPSTFIRFSGCNLKCSFCDTPQAQSQNHWIDLPSLFSSVLSKKINLISLTGGEPLFQKRIEFFASLLLKNGFLVAIDTNGSLDISKLPQEASIIMDVKTPSSKMSEFNQYTNFSLLGPNDQIKFVIKDKKDFAFAQKIILNYPIPKEVELIFSPVHNELRPKILLEWILKQGLNVRLSVQLHKYIDVR